MIVANNIPLIGKFIFFFLYLFSIDVYANNKNTIAVVDVHYILENSQVVQSIKKSVEIIGEKIQAEIEDKEKELKQAENDILKKRPKISDEAFNKLVNDFDNRVSKAQKDIQNKKAKLERAHVVAMRKVHEVTVDIIKKIAKRQGFEVVLPSAQVLFVNEHLDITSEVFGLLNSQLKQVNLQ